MRTMDIKIGKEGSRTVTLLASFQASIRIAREIADPLVIAREAMMEYQMAVEGVPYTPAFTFTVDNVTEMLWIGASEHDPDLNQEKFYEDCFDLGLAQCRLHAAEYLTFIVEPGVEVPGTDSKPKDKKSGKK